MTTNQILLCWLAFDAIIFLWAWIDHIYYTYNVSHKLKRINNALFEEA